MVQIPYKQATLVKFLALSETKPASEYIDGHILQKPIPQGKHSAVRGEFVPVINASVKPKRIARAFPELRCTFGNRSIVPDISVFVWSRIPRDDNGEIANAFEAAPDWTIEILSPDPSQTRVTKNILHCLEHGTQMGWLIDPGEQTIFTHLPDQALKVFEQPEMQLPVPTFTEGLQLTVGKLFGWLVD